MTADPNFWYLIAFVIFVVLLGRPLWRLTLDMLDDKIKHIRKDLEDAAHMKQEAQTLLNHSKLKQAEAQVQAERILSHAELEIKRIQQEAIDEVADFFTQQERQLQERLKNLEMTAFKELNEKIIVTAVASAREVIEKTLDKKLDAELITETLSDIEHAKLQQLN